MGGGNEWLHGYLEAILDVGTGRDRHREVETRSELAKSSGKNSSIREKLDDDRRKMENMVNLKDKDDTTRYFVQEIVNSFDEGDLHKTWIQVVATRPDRQRKNRLENMCWRIWHLSRKKKQIGLGVTQTLVDRRYERDKSPIDVAADLSELSEGEKEKGELCLTDSPAEKTRMNSDPQIWSKDESRKLYIVLISVHGLVRGENMELGRDSDTGGQVKYVVELARALANMESVHRVDLLTRQITSSEVDSTYSKAEEMLSCPSDGRGGAYIIRIPCGPTERYIPKESLWPYIAEFVDGSLGHIVSTAKDLGEKVNAGKPVWPYVIHGHYADAGEVAARLSGVLNVPMVLTGHSLGRNKLEQLLNQGKVSWESINATYKIMRRIEAEEVGLDYAAMIVTSTRQEITEQWGMYDGFDVQIERKLRIRRRRGVSCHGRCMPRMVVIPPGMDFSNVTVKDLSDSDGDLKPFISTDRNHKRLIPPIWSEIMRFFRNPHKPMILALSRPDPKKNITILLKSFGESQKLRELANLTLILGNRDSIEDMPESNSSVLTTVLMLIDKYDLYGQVACPKRHRQSEVPEIYRLAAKTKGVFINPAIIEPFGLTLIEAAAYGLPIVATQNGGPVDILKVLDNGLLVDPHDPEKISDALLKLVADKNLWYKCRENGLRNINKYSWPEHCQTYLYHVEKSRLHHPTNHLSVLSFPEEPLSGSFSDVEDVSVNFSKDRGELDAGNSQQKFINIPLQKASYGKATNVYSPGRRQWLYVVAVDSYNSEGNPTETLPLIIKNIMQATGSNSSHVGFVLLTGSSLLETLDMLRNSQLNIEYLDALVCLSGSEMYYPWRDLEVDEDYESHIQFRWPGENVKSVSAKTEEGDEIDGMKLRQSGSRCYSCSIKSGTKIPKIDDLRQRLRSRGLRCNMVYTNAATRLNVIPLYASRSQALRYLSVKWSINLSQVIVFLGERGDTDYEDLLGGLHKTIILRNSVNFASQMMVNTEQGVTQDDAIARSSTRIALADGFEVHDITKGLGIFRNGKTGRLANP